MEVSVTTPRVTTIGHRIRLDSLPIGPELRTNEETHLVHWWLRHALPQIEARVLAQLVGDGKDGE